MVHRDTSQAPDSTIDPLSPSRLHWRHLVGPYRGVAVSSSGMSSENFWHAGGDVEQGIPGVDDALIYVRVCHTRDGQRDSEVLRRAWDALVLDPFMAARRHDWRSFLIRRGGPPDLADLCDRLHPFLSERVAGAVTEVSDDFDSALLRIADVLLDHRSTVVGVVWVPRRDDFIFTSHAE